MTCLTLLVSPDCARGGLGRARVVSQQAVLFLFFGQNCCSDLSYIFVCIYRLLTYHIYVMKQESYDIRGIEQVAITLLSIFGWFDPQRALLVFV